MLFLSTYLFNDIIVTTTRDWECVAQGGVFAQRVQGSGFIPSLGWGLEGGGEGLWHSSKQWKCSQSPAWEFLLVGSGQLLVEDLL